MVGERAKAITRDEASWLSWTLVLSTAIARGDASVESWTTVAGGMAVSTPPALADPMVTVVAAQTLVETPLRHCQSAQEDECPACGWTTCSAGR